MLEDHPSVGHFPDVIDSTILSTYDSCPQKFYWEYILKLAGSGISPDLHAGGAFAHAIEAARNELWLGSGDLDTALQRATVAFIKYWGDYEPPEEHPKSFVNTINAVYDYFREYPPKTDPIRPYIMAGDKPAIEFTFSVPLPIMHPETGNPLLYGGRFDLLGYFNNVLTIVDEKTTKSLGAKWSKQWRMRGQFIGYAWAAQQHGINAQTAMIRGIAIQKTQYGHLQAIEPIANWRVEHWYNNMIAKVEDMVRDFERMRYLYSYGDACSSYFGCMFTDLCTSQNPEMWFGDYVRRVWNPLDKDPTKDNDGSGLVGSLTG